jgi:hypothetical protein
MNDLRITHRRPGHGAPIVRASTVAVGLAASVGLHMWGGDAPSAAQAGSAAKASIACTAGANGPFAFL